MRTATSVHGAIRAALTGAGVYAVDGPAIDLPVDPDTGMVAQAAVLWPAAGAYQYARSCGSRSGRADRVRIACVGATSPDALAVAEAVEAAIGGMRITANGGTLRQVASSDAPTPEPNSDPRRVSLGVEYQITTKGA